MPVPYCPKCRKAIALNLREAAKQRFCPDCRGPLFASKRSRPQTRLVVGIDGPPRPGILVSVRESRSARPRLAPAAPRLLMPEPPSRNVAAPPRARRSATRWLVAGSCLALCLLGVSAWALPSTPPAVPGAISSLAAVAPAQVMEPASAVVLPKKTLSSITAPTPEPRPVAKEKLPVTSPARIEPAREAIVPREKHRPVVSQPLPNEAVARIGTFKRRDNRSEDELIEELRTMREIDLDGKPGTSLKVLAEGRPAGAAPQDEAIKNAKRNPQMLVKSLLETTLAAQPHLFDDEEALKKKVEELAQDQLDRLAQQAKSAANPALQKLYTDQEAAFRQDLPTVVRDAVAAVRNRGAMPPLSPTLRQRWEELGLTAHTGADAHLGGREAFVLEQLPLRLRTHGIVSTPGPRGAIKVGGRNDNPDATRAMLTPALGGTPVELAVPSLVQTLQAEGPGQRLVLVEQLAKVEGSQASRLLAQRALYDTAPTVREAAVRALNDRPREEYREVLVDGLAYPWAPVADHAAEALVALQDRGAVPRLLEVLDKPAPDQPRPIIEGGKPMVKELVRINHFRNCLMCHAASFSADDRVPGPVPTAGKPLPVQYYAGARRSLPDSNFVRADVTYLRQDFSVKQPVADAAPWPEEQRYDYVVRSRPATRDEIDSSTEAGTSPQREAVQYALRELGEITMRK